MSKCSKYQMFSVQVLMKPQGRYQMDHRPKSASGKENRQPEEKDN